MYLLRDPSAKKDPERRWALPDRVFFACGACHILAYAFLRTYPDAGFTAVWLKPRNGRGNHVVLRRGDEAFDYHGYTAWSRLIEHFHRRNRARWPGWSAEYIELPPAVLVAGLSSQFHDGLHLRGPKEFLHDALPRAHRWLDGFPAPSEPGGVEAQIMAPEGEADPNPHFVQAGSWQDAGALVGFKPRVPRYTSGQGLAALQVHVRDHRLREVDTRSVEAHYRSFVLAQSRPGVVAARRQAFDTSYGSAPVRVRVQGIEAAAYPLGPVPDADDIDGRNPAVVTWADGDMFFLVASGDVEVEELLRVAESLEGPEA